MAGRIRLVWESSPGISGGLGREHPLPYVTKSNSIKTGAGSPRGALTQGKGGDPGRIPGNQISPYCHCDSFFPFWLEAAAVSRHDNGRPTP